MDSDRKRSILLIEDDAAICEWLTEKLLVSGFELQSCATAHAALDLLAKRKFDCVITDFTLEQGFGEDIITCLRCRNDHLNHATPIIAISAAIDQRAVAWLKSKGIPALRKPFKAPELISAIEQTLALVT